MYKAINDDRRISFRCVFTQMYCAMLKNKSHILFKKMFDFLGASRGLATPWRCVKIDINKYDIYNSLYNLQIALCSKFRLDLIFKGIVKNR